MSKFTDWIASIRVRSTRDTYREHLTRLFSLAGLEPDEALEVMLSETARFETYIRLVNIAKAQKPSVERLMTFALRRYLFDNGCLMLPRTRIQSRPASTVQGSLTWDQALTVCASASRPYGSVFRLMLHCGWGCGEFLRFNTKQTWKEVGSFLADKNGLPYFRYEFAGRKSNMKEWYALVPRFILEEFTQATEVPVRAKRQRNAPGILLDSTNYRAARTYMESAWRTAVRRSTVRLPSGNGRPVRLSVHELRDTFRTRAQKAECDSTASEFVMGHQVDSLGYVKTYGDIPWMWEQLKKIYGSVAASEEELGKLQKELAGMKEQIQEQIREEMDAEEAQIIEGVHGEDTYTYANLDFDLRKLRSKRFRETFSKEIANYVPPSTTPQNVAPPSSLPRSRRRSTRRER